MRRAVTDTLLVIIAGIATLALSTGIGYALDSATAMIATMALMGGLLWGYLIAYTVRERAGSNG